MQAEITIIQHVPLEGPGLFADALSASGCAPRVAPVFARGFSWPDPAEVSGALIMGGPMNVDETDRYPYLDAERRWIREVIDRGAPVLGICLGAQLIARALGAAVRPAPRKELGWLEITKRRAAQGDPLLQAFGESETVFQWHGDTFDLPAGAEWLCASEACAHQAFRWGEAYGLQFHIETTPATISSWLRHPAMRREWENEHGPLDGQALRRQTGRHAGRLELLGRSLAQAFCERVKDYSRGKREKHDGKAAAAKRG